MKNNSSRRSFLRKTTCATAGIALFSSTNILNAFNKVTSPYDGYNPYAKEISDLRSSALFGKYLNIQGKIFDISGISAVSNATVEVWHLSPNSTKYKHRAKLKTNYLGEYSFMTDFPNKEMGKTPRIYFKVTNGDSTYFTELLLNDFGAYITDKHWMKNKQLGDKLLPLQEGSINSSKIQFNISI